MNRADGGGGPAAARWRSLVERRRGEGPGGRDAQPCNLGTMAQRLRRDGARDMTATPVFQAVCEALGPERTVIDLGAGTGRYAVPLARAGCRVWAVEPSPLMRQHMVEALAAEDAQVRGRVTIVAGSWPEAVAGLPRAEVALASLVVHFHPDAPAFLRAMTAAATDRCVLAIRADQHHPLALRLWPRFHPDDPFPAQPVAHDLEAVLAEIGVRPQVTVHSAERPYGRYASQEEAVRQVAGILALCEPADLAALEAEVAALLRRDGEDGSWLADLPPVREALVAWKP